MDRILIAYYSFEGNTKFIAEALAKCLEADLMEIKPDKEIQSKGFSKYIWGGTQVVMGNKPKLVPFTKNINDYDMILVGTPIWAGTYAPPVKTLLEGNYIEGKKIAYFYCHKGGPGKAEEKAKSVIEKKNVFVGAKGFLSPTENKEISIDEVNKWCEVLK